MAKFSKKTENVVAPVKGVTAKCYLVAKDSHLLYEAYEVTLVDGVVTDVKCLSRAPDLAASAVGQASAAIWRALRDTTTETLK